MSHTGRLLVATPLIADSTFERTVVFVMAHSPTEGAFGLVVNRPSDTVVAEVAPDWAGRASSPRVVFIGGPVADGTVIGLARRPGGSEPAGMVVGEFATVNLLSGPDPDDVRPSGLRLFAGSAGWAPGQLEDELAEGAWWLVDAHEDDVICEDPGTLWTRVLRRQRGQMAWFALHPRDPTAN